jgi:hypothetical protein
MLSPPLYEREGAIWGLGPETGSPKEVPDLCHYRVTTRQARLVQLVIHGDLSLIACTKIGTLQAYALPLSFLTRTGSAFCLEEDESLFDDVTASEANTWQ